MPTRRRSEAIALWLRMIARYFLDNTTMWECLFLNEQEN